MNRAVSRRELNRTLLHRQMLLAREPLSVPAAVERLVGLQAQVNNPPYIGLWTRLHEFRREMLTQAMETRQVARSALMRSTLHLMTADDFARFRLALQPALTRALSAFYGDRARGVDIDRLVAAAQAALADRPRTFIDMRSALADAAPGRDADALAYAVRTHLPIVQVPPGGTWGTGGSPPHALAEAWFGRSLLPADEGLPLLIRRYLAAFGPATLNDFQAWSGLTRMREPLEALRSGLRVYRDEQGRELFDLPDLTLAAADAPAPVRFVPEYDNLVLSHDDRTRIIAEEFRSKVFLSAGRVRATFLSDGMVSGTWKTERAKRTATLVIEPFARLMKADRAALTEEGERLIRFIEDDADTHRVAFTEPD